MRWDWVRDHGDDIAAAARQHVELTAVAVGLGLCIAFPLALAARRWRRLEALVLAATGVLFTIPSLALFALFVPVYGLSRLTAEIGLVGYTLLILVRSILTGLEGVPADVREAARGMGYGPARLFLRVDLPLALPAFMAGLRIATVSTVALVTVGVITGNGGLGQLIIGGFNSNFYRAEIVTGAVGCVLLALIADVLLAGLERVLTPWTRAAR